MHRCGCMDCDLNHFSHAHHIHATNKAAKATREHDILGNVRETKDHLIDQGTYPDMFDP